MRIIYNVVLFCWALVTLPRVLYYYKKYKNNIIFRLGLKTVKVLPKKKGEYRIWIHAVSLGESKAVAKFVKKIREERKDAVIFFSTATETGQHEALKMVKHCFFLPLDFSWVMKKLVKRIEPDLFVLVETDFWYNLLRELKKGGVKTALVNGKLSLASYKKHKKFPLFAKPLFGAIDVFCVQSDTDQSRFLDLGVPKEKVHVTGNMKFDIESHFNPNKQLNFPKNETIVTIASTHENEEELILFELEKLRERDLCLLIAPRHPERFDFVAALLKKKNIRFRTIFEEGIAGEKVVLVNTMGVMDECYAHSKAVIMGGSFVSHVGGHNIYEAARHGIPVIYGPFMHKQEALMNALKKHHIGNQTNLSGLMATLEALLLDPQTPSLETLKLEVEGATERCVSILI